jgi:hypothetical protein
LNHMCSFSRIEVSFISWHVGLWLLEGILIQKNKVFWEKTFLSGMVITTTPGARHATIVARWRCFAIAFSPFSSPKEFAAIVELALSSWTLGKIILLKVYLIPSRWMSIVVYLRQRSRTRRVLMGIL